MISEMIVRCDTMWCDVIHMEGNAKKFRAPILAHTYSQLTQCTHTKKISKAAQHMKSKWKSNRIERCSTNEYLDKVVFIVSNEIFHCIHCFVRSLSASHASMRRAYARAHTHTRAFNNQPGMCRRKTVMENWRKRFLWSSTNVTYWKSFRGKLKSYVKFSEYLRFQVNFFAHSPCLSESYKRFECVELLWAWHAAILPCCCTFTLKFIAFCQRRDSSHLDDRNVGIANSALEIELYGICGERLKCVVDSMHLILRSQFSENVPFAFGTLCIFNISSNSNVSLCVSGRDAKYYPSNSFAVCISER